MIRPTFIDLNRVELKYYAFMICFDKCTGRFNVLSPKTCSPKETKDTNVKSSKIITTKTKLKQCKNIFQVIANANSIYKMLFRSKKE